MVAKSIVRVIRTTNDDIVTLHLKWVDSQVHRGRRRIQSPPAVTFIHAVQLMEMSCTARTNGN